jgi:hypothetical protein
MLAVGTAAAQTTEGAAGDGKASFAYDAATGNFTLQTDGVSVGLYDLRSTSGIFNATVSPPPNAGLGLNVDSTSRKSWAALPAQAITANHNLGNIAAPGLTKALLLGDLTITTSGGFGTANVVGDLVYLGGATGTPAMITDASLALGNRIQGAQISSQLAATGDPAPAWNTTLVPIAGNPTPATPPSLNAAGLFTWNSAGSPYGSYAWDVTASNASGSDTGRLSINIIVPEPATISLVGLTALGLVGLFRRRR